MAGQTIDYDALARQAQRAAPSIDYNGLANQARQQPAAQPGPIGKFFEAMHDLTRGFDPEPGVPIDEKIGSVLSSIAAIPSQMWDSLQKSGQAMAKGDAPAAAFHLAGAVPILGPLAQQVAQDVGNKAPAEALGHAVGLAVTAGTMRPAEAAAAVEPVADVAAQGANAVEAGARAAAPDIARGALKTAGGATVSAALHHAGLPGGWLLGTWPMYRGLRQMGAGFEKGWTAAKESLAPEAETAAEDPPAAEAPAAPAEDLAALDDYAKGLTGQPFSKLNAEQQAAVRNVMARSYERKPAAPAPSTPSPEPAIRAASPGLPPRPARPIGPVKPVAAAPVDAAPADASNTGTVADLSRQLNESLGAQPEAPAANTESFKAKARATRSDNATKLAQLINGAGITYEDANNLKPGDWGKIASAEDAGVTWPKTPAAQAKLRFDALKQLQSLEESQASATAGAQSATAARFNTENRPVYAVDPSRLGPAEDMGGEDPATVAKYRQLLRSGSTPPPVEGVMLPNGQINIVDGFHRTAAAKAEGQPVPVFLQNEGAITPAQRATLAPPPESAPETGALPKRAAAREAAATRLADFMFADGQGIAHADALQMEPDQWKIAAQGAQMTKTPDVPTIKLALGKLKERWDAAQNLQPNAATSASPERSIPPAASPEAASGSTPSFEQAHALAQMLYHGGRGLTSADALELRPEAWQMLGKSVGIAPTPAVIQQAIAELKRLERASPFLSGLAGALAQ